MSQWSDGTLEERVLLNPAFCANLLWHFAATNDMAERRPMTFAESFLLLPMVLHRATRDALPRTTRSSLGVWLDENPSWQASVAARAKVLVPYTKGALQFAGARGFLGFHEGLLMADLSWRRRVNAALRGSTDEVRLCARRATFIGAWFSEAGDAATVMSLIGVRP
jgi:hypothetical protein